MVVRYEGKYYPRCYTLDVSYFVVHSNCYLTQPRNISNADVNGSVLFATYFTALNLNWFEFCRREVELVREP